MQKDVDIFSMPMISKYKSSYPFDCFFGMLAILLVFAANLPPIVQPACGKAHWISLGGQFSSTFCLGQA